MNLYKANFQDEKNGVINYVKKRYPNLKTRGQFFIEGGNCNAVNNLKGKIDQTVISFVRCSRASWFFCELKKPRR